VKTKARVSPGLTVGLGALSLSRLQSLPPVHSPRLLAIGGAPLDRLSFRG
jgi:hypothetical protein